MGEPERVIAVGGQMKKLIFLTFGFLAWAFYEMSGGQDFQPGTVSAFSNVSFKASEPIVESEPQPAPQEVVARSDSSAADLTRVAKAPVVQVEPSKAAEVLARGLRLPAVTDQAPAAEPAAASGQSDRAIIASAAIGLKSVPADLRGAEPGSAISRDVVRYVPTAPVSDDVRRVSGNRVNMRNGPGTNHNVVAKLSRGDALIVLQEPGSGWLKVRVEETGRIGWIADFLVTASN